MKSLDNNVVVSCGDVTIRTMTDGRCNSEIQLRLSKTTLRFDSTAGVRADAAAEFEAAAHELWNGLGFVFAPVEMAELHAVKSESVANAKRSRPHEPPESHIGSEPYKRHCSGESKKEMTKWQKWQKINAGLHPPSLET